LVRIAGATISDSTANGFVGITASVCMVGDYTGPIRLVAARDENCPIAANGADINGRAS
jgi:hypothetical protein